MPPTVQVLPAPLPELKEGERHYVRITFPGALSGLPAHVRLSGCVRASDDCDSLTVMGTQASGPTPSATIQIKATKDGCPTITVESPDGRFAERSFNGVNEPGAQQLPVPKRPPVLADYASEEIDFSLLQPAEDDDASQGPIVGPPMLPPEDSPADRSAEEQLMEDVLNWLYLVGDPSPQYETADEPPSDPPILSTLDQENLMSKQGDPDQGAPHIPDPSATQLFHRDDLAGGDKEVYDPPMAPVQLTPPMPSAPLTAEALAAAVDEDGDDDPSKTGMFALPAPRAARTRPDHEPSDLRLPPMGSEFAHLARSVTPDPSLPPPSAAGGWRERTDDDFTSSTGPAGLTPKPPHPGDDMSDDQTNETSKPANPFQKDDDSKNRGWLIAAIALFVLMGSVLGGLTLYSDYVNNEGDVLEDAAVDVDMDPKMEVDMQVEVAPPPADLTMCDFVDPNRTEVGGKVQVTCAEGGPYWVIARYEGAGRFSYADPSVNPPSVD